ncbi:DinB family protein [Mucilaginibacter gossypii]|uniref:DinB family protein n=1 Tax=Mucilaginibacter gossypii TaxID=551996 RepID=UPI000DCF00B6|nr:MULTISPECIES: DinB family protein [Mucilaginibacter]QTE38470.1 DinB family protein [Mucilaginibacter gossypii]RAV59687.1 DinB family protein [Mucilaginibacter rubeus]
MSTQKLPEVWLRGPLDDVPALLQPVAHALLQAREELNELMIDFPEKLLWQKLAGMASPGFHLQHLTGVLNRLFTYAKGEGLSAAQLNYLAAEGEPGEHEITVVALIKAFNTQVDGAIDQLKATDEAMLTEWRGVGRGQLPSTVIGLYTHSAEHTMRHLGQLLVTVKVLKQQ